MVEGAADNPELAEFFSAVPDAVSVYDGQDIEAIKSEMNGRHFGICNIDSWTPQEIDMHSWHAISKEEFDTILEDEHISFSALSNLLEAANEQAIDKDAPAPVLGGQPGSDEFALATITSQRIRLRELLNSDGALPRIPVRIFGHPLTYQVGIPLPGKMNIE